jgi:predicted amidohydrolase
MTAPRSLAAAQTIPRRGDVDANLEAHVRLVRMAAEERARVVVFPELSLTGYELDLADALAFSERDPRLSPLVELASAHGLTLVVGAPVRVDRRLHLGAFILSPDRSVDVYTKHRLGAFPSDANPGGPVPPAEGTVFHPGDRSPLVRFGGNAAAVAVCADVRRPSHPREAVERGAKTFLASMFVIPADLDADAALLRQHAVGHSLTVVFANFGGPSGGLPAAGRSAIISDRGEPLVELPASGAGIAVAVEERTGWRTRAIMAGG